VPLAPGVQRGHVFPEQCRVQSLHQRLHYLAALAPARSARGSRVQRRRVLAQLGQRNAQQLSAGVGTQALPAHSASTVRQPSRPNHPPQRTQAPQGRTSRASHPPGTPAHCPRRGRPRPRPVVRAELTAATPSAFPSDQTPAARGGHAQLLARGQARTVTRARRAAVAPLLAACGAMGALRLRSGAVRAPVRVLRAAPGSGHDAPRVRAFKRRPRTQLRGREGASDGRPAGAPPHTHGSSAAWRASEPSQAPGGPRARLCAVETRDGRELETSLEFGGNSPASVTWRGEVRPPPRPDDAGCTDTLPLRCLSRPLLAGDSPLPWLAARAARGAARDPRRCSPACPRRYVAPAWHYASSSVRTHVSRLRACVSGCACGAVRLATCRFLTPGPPCAPGGGAGARFGPGDASGLRTTAL